MKLSDLKSAFQPLLDVSHKEKIVEVAGVSLTLRTISPKEEADIQNSLPVISEGEEGASAMEFVDVFRKETLSRSIIQVGELNLRQIEYVETEDKTSSGVSVKVRKEEAVHQMMEGWSRPILTSVFNSFTDLVEELEQELNSILLISPSDSEAEVEVLKERINDIERQDAMKKVSDHSKDILKEVSDIKGGLFDEALRDADS